MADETFWFFLNYGLGVKLVAALWNHLDLPLN